VKIEKVKEKKKKKKKVKEEEEERFNPKYGWELHPPQLCWGCHHPWEACCRRLGAASTSALLGLPSSLGGVLPPPVASGVATIFRRRAATASNTVCSVAYSS